MKIVTTPMCEDVMKLSGVKEYDVNLIPDSTDSDIAVVLSETNTSMSSVKIKLNTFQQIRDSVKMLMEMFHTENMEYNPEEIVFHGINKSRNRNINVKVYSNFLRDILEDLGYSIVTEDEDYLVYPDYLRDNIMNEIISKNERAVEVSSHKNSPKDPIKRAELRYKLLEKKLCMKH